MIDWNRWKSWDHKIVLFSGGKDSTVTLHLVKSHYDDARALFVHTTCAVPGLVEHVKQVCDLLDIPLEIIRPKVNFWELLEKWGSPTIRRRWCMKHLKMKPMQEYLRKLEGSKVLFDGRRAAESWMRRKFFERWHSRGAQPGVSSHKYFRVFCVSPIWNWTNREVSEYIRKHNLPISPFYRILGAGGDCVCPAFKTLKFYQRLRVHYPKIFMQMVEIEEKYRSGGSFAYVGNRELYLREMLKQKLITDFL